MLNVIIIVAKNELVSTVLLYPLLGEGIELFCQLRIECASEAHHRPFTKIPTEVVPFAHQVVKHPIVRPYYCPDEYRGLWIAEEKFAILTKCCHFVFFLKMNLACLIRQYRHGRRW